MEIILIGLGGRSILMEDRICSRFLNKTVWKDELEDLDVGSINTGQFLRHTYQRISTEQVSLFWSSLFPYQFNSFDILSSLKNIKFP